MPDPDALTAFYLALEEDPGDPVTLLALADIYERALGRPADAIAALRSAADLDPNDARLDVLDLSAVGPTSEGRHEQRLHAILEVIPNTALHRLSDPRAVYVLRWIAGRRAGVPEFDPAYTIS